MATATIAPAITGIPAEHGTEESGSGDRGASPHIYSALISCLLSSSRKSRDAILDIPTKMRSNNLFNDRSDTPNWLVSFFGRLSTPQMTRGNDLRNVYVLMANSNSSAFRTKPSSYVILVSSVSATLGAVITQPLDVIKTRLQVLPILNMRSSVGVLRTAKSLWSGVPPHNRWAHRIRLFWAGTVPSLCRTVPGIFAYFTTVNFFQSHLPRCGSSAVDAFTLGFTSRCLVGTLLLPFTVVKSQAEAGLTRGRSTFSSLCWIYSTAKWRGIYSGLLPTLARDSPYSGVYLLFYSQFKNLVLPSDTSYTTAPVHTLSACALLAAICATAVTQPADVLRSNRQLSISAIPSTSRIPWTQVLRETIRVDGITGPWRGFYLRLARRSVFAVITWTLFDKIPGA
ncbi:solute carrier family 25 8 [Echinococcus multilocularis]|uniref:Solute carrier family 25 8 n=1 Tax=Echinococcus multilocularis TaxID=6211 RepID=A0A087W0M0_ECHMU|nr:solute carrier family 25 8 [Echinococcus multilocularis]